MVNYIQKFTSVVLATFIFSISTVIAQAPLGFNYQGVALTNAGTPVSNKVISLRIALIESQQLGTTRFQETHNVNTDAYGQFSVIIGNGQATTGKMSDVQWSKFPYYMKVELDLNGGTAYVFVGTSQLLSVPYALYANNAGAASISVDSVKSELATIRLVQKGDSIVLNNNRGGVFIPKIDSLAKIASQISTIKTATIKVIKDSATKQGFGFAIGNDALKNMDSVVINSNNYAIGFGAGASLSKGKDVNNYNDNILFGTASGAGLGAANNGGATQNIMIGNYAGQNALSNAIGNVLLGWEAGRFSSGTIANKTVGFNQNVAIGRRALQYAKNAENNVAIGSDNFNASTDVSRNVSIGANTASQYFGDDNVFLGAEMLKDTSSNGSKNVIIGAAVATNLRGSGNVILGYKAANDSIFLNTSNRLIIANDKTKTPLIYGEFDNKKVTINGDLTVTGKTTLSGTSVSDSTIKLLNKRIDSLITAISTKNYGRIDSSTLYIANPITVNKFLDSTFLPSINFDGSKTYVQIGATGLLGTRIFGSNFSVETWLKSLKVNDTIQYIYGTGYSWNGGSGNFKIGLYKGRVIVEVGNFSGYKISCDYPKDSLWHHVAFIHDNQNKIGIIYIDGVEKVRLANLGSQNMANGTSGVEGIGANLDLGGEPPREFFKGYIRKIRVSKGLVYKAGFTPSFTYTKADSTLVFWELNDLGTRIKASDSAYNGTLYNGAWLVPDTSSLNLNLGLVAYYPFNGNANDSSSNNLTGVITGATLTNDRFGNANKAFKFSGNSINDNTVVVKDEFIKVSNFNKNFSDKISISLWANVDSTNYGGFLQRRVDNNIDFAISSYAGSNGTSPDPNTISWSIGNNRTNTGKTIIPYKTWHNYIYVYDGTSMKTYLDGILETQTAATGLISNNTSDLFIGKYIYNGGKTHHFYYNGSMDDVRIYNRVLNSNEISALSTENGAPLTLKTGDSYGGGLVAYIYQPSDSGYIAGQVHGIIAAKTDQGTASWGCEGTLIGTTNGLGKGKFNTEQIIAKCSDTATAAKICKALTLNGYSDWYFPSLDEMKQLRLNLHLKGLGNFRTDLSYFVSTETSATTANEFYISSAATGGINKQGNKMAVRAVRYF
jgi:hypothetical protein